MTREKLDELIYRSHEKFPSEYKGFLSNHLTQGLIALFRIGGSDDDLQHFYDNYIVRLKDDKVIPSQGIVNENNFHEYIGKGRNYLDLYDFFLKELNTKGASPTLDKFSDLLAPGLSGAAFHGLIRLGYGVDLGTEELIAEGLAYLAFSYFKTLDFGQNEISVDGFDLIYILKALDTIHSSLLLQQVYKIPSFKESPFQKKLSVVFPSIQKYSKSNRPDLWPFFEFFPRFISSEQASFIVNRLVQASIALFSESGANDFFLLHCVSASRAAQFLISRIESGETRSKIVSYLWLGLLLTYVNQGMPSISNLVQSFSNPVTFCHLSLDLTPRWNKVIEKARRSTEEHVIKMVYVLKDEEDKWRLTSRDQRKCVQSFTLETLFIETAEKMIQNSGLNGETFIFGGKGFFDMKTDDPLSHSKEEVDFLHDLQSHL